MYKYWNLEVEVGGICDTWFNWYLSIILFWVFISPKSKLILKDTLSGQLTLQWSYWSCKAGTSPPIGICCLSSSNFISSHLFSSSRVISNLLHFAALASKWALLRDNAHGQVECSKIIRALWRTSALGLLKIECLRSAKMTRVMNW